MALTFRAIRGFMRQYPVTRGIVVSAILWPTSNFCQQSLAQREKYDFGEMGRFCAFGSLVSAPTIYHWLNLVNRLIPGQTIGISISKAIIIQLTYSPAYNVCFYIGLNAVEGKSRDECVAELKEKFWPTIKSGFLVWPLSQTLCYLFIKPRNHVPILSTVGFFWTMYLSYLKNLELKQELNQSISISGRDKDICTIKTNPLELVHVVQCSNQD